MEHKFLLNCGSVIENTCTVSLLFNCMLMCIMLGNVDRVNYQKCLMYVMIEL